ncbi:MAG: porin family protein [Alphaproteobacteria bacterium]|nr:porin family protein [Alphaproteobacteria bacterium]
MKSTLLATAALAALALAAPANAAGTGWYVNVSGGANWLDDNGFTAVNGPDTLTVNTDADTGWVISGAIGYSLAKMVTPGLRVEIEAAYRENSVDGDWSSATPGLDSGLLTYDHSAFSVMANAWYDFDVAGVRPYFGGGIGWADVEADGTFIGGVIPAFSTSDDGFAWQLGAGINFDISPNVQLGVGYRYMQGPEVTLGAPFAANSAAGDLDYDNHSGVVSVTFVM